MEHNWSEETWSLRVNDPKRVCYDYQNINYINTLFARHFNQLKLNVVRHKLVIL